jgi:hypothetical protein
MRNTRCEQMFSAVLPGADIRRTERDVRQHFPRASNRFERASGHVEAVPLYPDNARMPHGLRDRTSRLRRRRLQLTVGTEGELLSDRGGKNPLALADFDTHDQRLSNRTARRLASRRDRLVEIVRDGKDHRSPVARHPGRCDRRRAFFRPMLAGVGLEPQLPLPEPAPVI